jgi:hypothetical protein
MRKNWNTRIGHISFWSTLMMLIHWKKHNAINTITEALMDASKEFGLEVNAEEIKHAILR